MPDVAGQVIQAGRMSGSEIARQVETSNSGNISTTETTVISVTPSLISGVRYTVELDTGVGTNANGQVVNARIREDSDTGTEMQLRAVDTPNTGHRWPAKMEADYTAVSTGSKTFVATLDLSVGGSTCFRMASSTIPAILRVVVR